MALSAGTRLGPYEVVEALGAGGMGEVYKARDTRIGRSVAIKVLPPDVETDPDRRRRFHQEAVAAGALSHPNILVVHDVGHEGGRPFLVTELLRGATLRDALRGGPLPQDRATSYAAALLDGLAAAHAQGIVHRDIKPENIFITSDDVAKLLDFGLARLPAGFHWGAGTGATATSVGSLVGSVGYMAPEQITGGPIDQRSDIFSMGVVLHEMLGGAPPFARTTAIESLNAIVTADPAPPAGVGEPLGSVLTRALHKSPDHRFQTAADFAFALRLPAAHPAAPAAGRRSSMLFAATAVLGLVVVAMGAMLWRNRQAAAGAPAPASVTFSRITFEPGRVWSARFVPGGDTIVYAASWKDQPNRLYSARTGFPSPTDLRLPPADLLGVSSSGELALLLGRRWLQGMEPSSGVLARAPMAGGAPRELANIATAGDWSPDGQIAAVRELVGVRRLEFPLGHPLYETAGWIDNVRVSRDGTRVALADHPLRTDDRGSFVVVDRAGAVTRVATDLDTARGLAWGPDGRELWATIGREIVAFDLKGGRRTVYLDPRGILLQDVAPDGRMLAVVNQPRMGLSGQLGGEPERDLTWFDYSVARDISRDGKMLLFFETGGLSDGEYTVGLWRAGEAAPVRLGEGHAMSLSADGSLALAIKLAGPVGLRILPIGAGETREVATPAFATLSWATWLPDGHHVIVSANEKGHGMRLYLMDTTGKIIKPVGPEGTSYQANAVSPDGTRVAAHDPDHHLAIYRIEDGTAAIMPSVLPDERPLGWTADGTELYVVTPGIPCRVSRVNVATGARTPWREVMPPDQTGLVRIFPVLVAPRGDAYAYTYGRFLSTLYVVTGAR